MIQYLLTEKQYRALVIKKATKKLGGKVDTTTIKESYKLRDSIKVAVELCIQATKGK